MTRCYAALVGRLLSALADDLIPRGFERPAVNIDDPETSPVNLYQQGFFANQFVRTLSLHKLLGNGALR